jgi:hypothetical protein
MRGVRESAPAYQGLMKPKVRTYPIPYFGDPSRAVIATVGLNPSATEFQSPRWSKPPSIPQELDEILCGYFNSPYISAHPWFKLWTQCLRKLGHSYEADAVHLDLSPRATRNVGSLDPYHCAEMVAEDLRWFFSALNLCVKVKAILMAGTVTKQFYVDHFLCLHAPRHGYMLSMKRSLGVAPMTTLYELRGSDRAIPAFFCGSGPSSRDKGVKLLEGVGRHVETLKRAGF